MCSRYVIVGRMHVRLNDDPLEEDDYFKYLGWQVAAVGCGTQNDEVYQALEPVLSNRGLGIKAIYMKE